jgi:transposase-like protein
MAHSILSDERFHNEDAAFAYVEAQLWPEGPTCPHCGNADTAKIGRLQGKTTRPGLRKCYACRKAFTVRIGTIFEDSHLPLRLWLQAIHLLCASKKGYSTRQLQRTLCCGMKTAWHLNHRIRFAMKPDATGPLGGNGGTVEADETYIGGLEKNRHASKRKGVHGPEGKAPVVSLVERGGAIRSHHVPNVTSRNVGKILEANMAEGATFFTDDSKIYGAVKPRLRPHATVRHTDGEYVRYTDDPLLPIHTNTVEGFFSILKRGINGVYHHVSEAHLHRYLSEFDFRYTNREARGVDDVARADRAIRGAKGKRLTYETTREA